MCGHTMSYTHTCCSRLVTYVCMYIMLMVITYYYYSKLVRINRVRLPILLVVVSRTGKINVISLSLFAPENLLVSREDGFGSHVPRQPAHLRAYLRDSSRFPRRRPFIYIHSVDVVCLKKNQNALMCLTFSAYWLPTRKKLLYTVANPARGLLNREKRTKEKVWQHTSPPTPPPCSFGEK